MEIALTASQGSTATDERTLRMSELRPVNQSSVPWTRVLGKRSASSSSDRTQRRDFAEAAALAWPSAWRLLGRLGDTGVVTFNEIEEELDGWQDWLGIGQLLRAGFASEGHAKLHITSAGRNALRRLRAAHPEVFDAVAPPRGG